MAWNIAELADKAESSEGSEEQEAKTSLPPDDNPEDAEQSTDEGQSDSGAPGADPGANEDETADTVEPDKLEEPPVSPDEPVSVKTVRDWGKGWEKDAKAARAELETVKPVVDVVEQLGGVEVVQPLLGALLSENVDTEKFCDELIAQRGESGYSAFVWGLYSRHVDNFAQELFNNPKEIQDPKLRAQVEAFNKFKTFGKEQPVIAEEDDESGESDELSDEEIALLPQSMQKKIRADRDFRRSAEQDIEELKKHKQREESDREAQARERAEAEVTRRTADLDKIFVSVIDNLTSAVSFSTALDEKTRNEENDYYRKTIRSNLNDDLREKLRTDPAARKTFADLKDKFIDKGDRVGSKTLLQQAKETIQTLAEPHIRRFEKRSSAEVEALKGPQEKVPVAIPGNGQAAPVLPPPEPRRRAFDLGAMEQKASR